MDLTAKRTLWVNALRSGEYKQGQACLRQGDYYCCLGVACEVYQKHGPGDLEVTELNNMTAYDGSNGYLPKKVAKWFDLNFMGALNGSASEYALTVMNDTGKTFNYIADYIENNPKDLDNFESCKKHWDQLEAFNKQGDTE